VPYKDVNEKLLHLSHLLSIGSPRDTYRQGMLQEEDLTLFNGDQSEAGPEVDTLNNRDNKPDLALCNSCGAILACDAIVVEKESAESEGGQEAVLRVFRVCGLANDQNRASLNRVGEFIYSFFCYLQCGPQHLEEACMRSASCLKLLCADCYGSEATAPLPSHASASSTHRTASPVISDHDRTQPHACRLLPAPIQDHATAPVLLPCALPHESSNPPGRNP
jgi:hypothetical protein